MEMKVFWNWKHNKEDTIQYNLLISDKSLFETIKEIDSFNLDDVDTAKKYLMNMLRKVSFTIIILRMIYGLHMMNIVKFDYILTLMRLNFERHLYSTQSNVRIL